MEEVVSGEAMYAQQDAIISAQHIVGSLGTSLIEESGFDVVSYDDLLESIINTAAVAAQDPAVQRAVQRVLERHGDASQTLKFMEQRASLRASPAGPVPIHGPQSPGESWTLAQPPPSEVHSLSSSMSATVSDLMEADAVINKSFLDRHAVPLQKAARGWLARKRRHAAEIPSPAEGVLLSHLPTEPRVILRLLPMVGTVRVALDLRIISVRQSPPRHDPFAPAPLPFEFEAREAEEAKEAAAEQGSEAFVKLASVVAIIVGLLAVVISRNPQAARAASVAAAAVVVSMCAKANLPRRPV